MPGELAPRPFALEDVVITGELDCRPARQRNSDLEIQALHSLAAQLHEGEPGLLDALMDVAVRLCGAGTAGVSLLERADDGSQIFRWVALAGRLKDAVGGTTPRNFSPCGTCLDRGRAQLYDRPGRYFTYLQPAGIVEGLVVPFRSGEDLVGTIWIVSHDESVHFDSEDLRMMTSLGGFTATALRLKLASTESDRRLREARETRLRAEEFVGMLGHELRGALEALTCGLGQVRQQAEAVAAKQLDGVERQVRNLGDVVEGLLDASRVLRGTFPIQRQKILLETVVARVASALQPRLEARRHQLTLHLDRGIIVDADPLRLEQMLARVAGADLRTFRTAFHSAGARTRRNRAWPYARETHRGASRRPHCGRERWRRARRNLHRRSPLLPARDRPRQRRVAIPAGPPRQPQLRFRSWGTSALQSRAAVGTDGPETIREHSFCSHVILERDLFVVPDATLDSRFASLPSVTASRASASTPASRSSPPKACWR